MGCFGDNYGANYDLCDGEPAVETPTKSISHTTLDAGVDLRRRDRQRKVEVLKLSIEIPFTGTSFKKEKLLIPFESVTKSSGLLSVPLRIIVSNRESLKIPLKVASTVRQKLVIPFTGEKKYSKALLKSNLDRNTMMKIDTLKEMLRELDEE